MRPSTTPVVSVQEPQSPEPISPEPMDDRLSFSDLLTDDEALHYNGYLIETRYKNVSFDKRLKADQDYVVLSKNGKLIRSFDGMFYHPVGNIVGFGLFSFLGTGAQQLAISQGVGRGGVQWIVDVSEQVRVIFDGEAWGVGRESDDCEVKDLDGDGIFEISLPITDFYSMMDKMAVAGVPLPMITFKYDPAKKKYVLVNHLMNEAIAASEPDIEKESDELYVRSLILRHMLGLIYEGKRQQAWQYFDTTYNLNDKKEIERRVKDILKHQRVYKYIYNHH